MNRPGQFDQKDRPLNFVNEDLLLALEERDGDLYKATRTLGKDSSFSKPRLYKPYPQFAAIGGRCMLYCFHALSLEHHHVPYGTKYSYRHGTYRTGTVYER